METSNPVQSWMYFLQKDPKFETERVYELRRQKPTKKIPQTNMLLEKVEGIPIYDVRPQLEQCSFNTTGFFLLDMDTGLVAEDFDQRSKVMNVFLPQLAAAVKDKLNASRVQIFDYQLRKRNRDFPISNGEIYEYRQPSCLAHVDATPGDIERLRHGLNKGNFERVNNVRCQFVKYASVSFRFLWQNSDLIFFDSAWKPLRGPTRDWPLGLCDNRSVDPEVDLKICDLVAPDGTSETASVHHSPKQRWCYVSDQMPNEIWVFMQSDSNGTSGMSSMSGPRYLLIHNRALINGSRCSTLLIPTSRHK
ncbi:hypothetical protein QBC36DRAFT_189998 [Triangularia setosa]|uniref:Uncharacterized protein n=1 Tax=Triangularia setosa TaxID=2587417 RepID=A0AAN7A4T4_9PEZI|nr:hypothetical protein QBC36DRAFT_189998 [Podospora setosa]